MNTPVPTWRELGQRIALLIIVEARAIRRRYRHWRVRRRVVRSALHPSLAPVYVMQAALHGEPGQVILWNGERDSLPLFRPPNPGSVIPGPRLAARPGGKR